MPNPRANATASARGTIYQLCSAVKAAFDLRPGERLLIEEMGDLSVPGEHQSEIKHYNDELTDGHANFWNTLYNWCLGGTDVDAFRALVLATTQPFGVRSRIAAWSDLGQTQRLALLRDLHQDHERRFLARGGGTPKPTSVLAQQRALLAPANEVKLLAVVGKTVIDAALPMMGELYSSLMTQWFRGVEADYQREAAMNSLIGYVCRPTKTSGSAWEIDYEGFNKEYQDLLGCYVGRKREFPRAALERRLTVSSASPPVTDPFVRKIMDIDHYRRIPTAILEYYSAIETIDKEFREHTTNLTRLQSFRYSVTQRFQLDYETACLDTPLDNAAAKRFYNATMSAQAPDFVGYADSPDWFRNGLLHTMMNDESASYQWKLVADE